MTTSASSRFDRIASNYATSEVHRASPTIRRLLELVPLPPGSAICDVACGAGHLALALAARGARATGVDPAPNMLAAFRALAQENGVAVETVSAHAEDVPLDAGAFALVATRLAAHHFADLDRAVREMARLAAPGGRVAVIDLVGYADDALDAFNHRLEVLHDPTHVRSYTVARWRAAFASAGLALEVAEDGHRESVAGVPVRRWCEIAASGAAAEGAIRAALADAPAGVLDALGIARDERDYLVPVRTLLLIGRKPGREG